MEIQIKRIYDSASQDDGLRLLVDRLWPRGIKKSDLKCDVWAKELAPSTILRKTFHADIEARWDDFVREYTQELMSNSSFESFMTELIKSSLSKITLLYSSKNKDLNNAVVLRQLMIRFLSSRTF